MFISKKNKLSYLPLAMLFLGATPISAQEVNVNIDYFATDETPSNLKTDSIILNGKKDLTLYYKKNDKCTISEKESKGLPNTGIDSVDLGTLALASASTVGAGVLLYKKRKYSKHLLVLASLAGIGTASLDTLAKEFSLKEATKLSVQLGEAIKFTPDSIDCYDYIGYVERDNKNSKLENSKESNTNNSKDNAGNSANDKGNNSSNSTNTSDSSVNNSSSNNTGTVNSNGNSSTNNKDETNSSNSNNNNGNSTNNKDESNSSNNNEKENTETTDSSENSSVNDKDETNNSSSNSDEKDNAGTTDNKENSSTSNNNVDTNSSSNVDKDNAGTTDNNDNSSTSDNNVDTNSSSNVDKDNTGTADNNDNSSTSNNNVDTNSSSNVDKDNTGTTDNNDNSSTNDKDETSTGNTSAPDKEVVTPEHPEDDDYSTRPKNRTNLPMNNSDVAVGKSWVFASFVDVDTNKFIKDALIILEEADLGTSYVIDENVKPMTISYKGETYEFVSDNAPEELVTTEGITDLEFKYKKKKTETTDTIKKGDLVINYTDPKTGKIIKSVKVLENQPFGTAYVISPEEIVVDDVVYEPIQKEPVTGVLGEETANITLNYKKKETLYNLVIDFINPVDGSVLKSVKVIDNQPEGTSYSYTPKSIVVDGVIYEPKNKEPLNGVVGEENQKITIEYVKKTDESNNNTVDTPNTGDNTTDTPNTGDNATDTPNTGDNATDSPNTGDNATDSPNTGDNATDSPNTGDNATDTPNTGDNATDSPNTGDNATDSPNTGDNATDSPNTGDNATDSPNTGDNATDSPNTGDNATDTPNTGDNATDSPNTGDNATDSPNTDDNVTDTPTEDNPEENQLGSIVIHYTNADKGQILKTVTLVDSQPFGTNYSVDLSDLVVGDDTYEAISKEPITGVVEKDSKTIVVKYKKKVTHGNVVFNYTDPETGKVIKTVTVLENQPIGSDYSVNLEDLIVEDETYEAINKEPITGTVSEETVTHTINYRKKEKLGSVEVNYTDPQTGRIIKTVKVVDNKPYGTSYTINPDDLVVGDDTYEAVSKEPITGVVGEENKTITFNYAPKVQTGSIVVNYTDPKTGRVIKTVTVVDNQPIGTEYTINPDDLVLDDGTYEAVDKNPITGRVGKTNEPITVNYKKKVTHGRILIKYVLLDDSSVIRTDVFKENVPLNESYTFTPRTIEHNNLHYIAWDYDVPITGTVTEEETVIEVGMKQVEGHDVVLTYREQGTNKILKMEKIVSSGAMGSTYSVRLADIVVDGRTYEPVDNNRTLEGEVDGDANKTVFYTEKHDNKIEISYVDRENRVIKTETVLSNLRVGENWEYTLTDFVHEGTTYTPRTETTSLSGVVERGTKTITVPYKDKNEQPVEVTVKYLADNVELKASDVKQFERDSEFTISPPKTLTYMDEIYELLEESNELTGVADSNKEVIARYKKAKVYTVKLVLKAPGGKVLKEIVLAENKPKGTVIPETSWREEWSEVEVDGTTYRVNNDSAIPEFTIEENADSNEKTFERLYTAVEKVNAYFDVAGPDGVVVKRIPIATNKPYGSTIDETPWNEEWNTIVVEDKTYIARDKSNIPSFTLTREQDSIKRNYELAPTIAPVDLKVFYAFKDDVDMLKAREDGVVALNQIDNISLTREPLVLRNAMTPTDEAHSNITELSAGEVAFNNYRDEIRAGRLFYYRNVPEIPERIRQEIQRLGGETEAIKNSSLVLYETDNGYVAYDNPNDPQPTAGQLTIPKTAQSVAGPFVVPDVHGVENGQMLNYAAVVDTDDNNKVVGIIIYVQPNNN